MRFATTTTAILRFAGLVLAAPPKVVEEFTGTMIVAGRPNEATDGRLKQGH